MPYQPEFVSGFQARGLPGDAAGRLPHREADRSTRRCGPSSAATSAATSSASHSVSTRYGDVKFKHVLLPVWISAYRYRDKAYRFLVNGQTGEVSGESPKSWWKIAFLVLAILVVLFVILMAGGKR